LGDSGEVGEEGPGEVIAGLYLMDQSIFPAIVKTKLSTRGEFELTDSIQFLIDHDRRFRMVLLQIRSGLVLVIRGIC